MRRPWPTGGGAVAPKTNKLTLTGNRSGVELNCAELDVALRCTRSNVALKSTLCFMVFLCWFSLRFCYLTAEFDLVKNFRYSRKQIRAILLELVRIICEAGLQSVEDCTVMTYKMSCVYCC